MQLQPKRFQVLKINLQAELAYHQLHYNYYYYYYYYYHLNHLLLLHTDSLKPSYLCALPLFMRSLRQCPRARISHCASSTSDALNWSNFPVFIFLNMILLLWSFNLPGFCTTMHQNSYVYWLSLLQKS